MRATPHTRRGARALAMLLLLSSGCRRGGAPEADPEGPAAQAPAGARAAGEETTAAETAAEAEADDVPAGPPDPRIGGEVAGLYSDSHAWVGGTDPGPQALLYFQSGADGGVHVYSGLDHDPDGANPWLDRRRQGDAVEGDHAMWYRRPRLGEDSPTRDAKNASGRLLWRTFGPEDGAPFDLSRFRFVNVWVKPLDGFDGFLGISLGSWDPAEGGANGDAGTLVARRFPQRVSGDRWQALSVPLDVFDGVDFSKFAKFVLTFDGDADGRTFLFDDLTFSVERHPSAGPPSPRAYAITEPGEDPERADDRIAVRLDPARLHQRIRGFGFHGDHASRRALITDLGASLVRIEIPAKDPPRGRQATRASTHGWEPVNDDRDDMSFLRTLDGFDRADVEDTLRFMRAYRAIDPNVGFFACAWSPPGWMKRSGRVGGGSAEGAERNRIRDGHLGEYGEYLASFALHLHREGLPLLALAMGNEVYFDHDFPSMHLTGGDMVVAIGETHRRLEAAVGAVEGFERPLLMAEDHVLRDHFFRAHFVPFLDAVGRSEALQAALDIVSYHAYGVDALSPERASTTVLGKLRQKARETVGEDVELWMTETSGFHNGLLDEGGRKGALTMAEGLYTSLAYGDVAAWVYYGPDELLHYGRPGWPGVALKHWARFVRPGARRFEAAVSEQADRVLVTAFRNAARSDLGDSVAVVVVNLDDRPHGLDLGALSAVGPGSHRWREYRSSAHHACDDRGAIDPTAPYVVPPHGIVTLYRGRPIPTR